MIKQWLLKVTLEDKGTPGSTKRRLGWIAYRLYPVLYPGELKEPAKKVEKMKWLLVILSGTFLLGLTDTWGWIGSIMLRPKLPLISSMLRVL